MESNPYWCICLVNIGIQSFDVHQSHESQKSVKFVIVTCFCHNSCYPATCQFTVGLSHSIQGMLVFWH